MNKQISKVPLVGSGVPSVHDKSYVIGSPQYIKDLLVQTYGCSDVSINPFSESYDHDINPYTKFNEQVSPKLALNIFDTIFYGKVLINIKTAALNAGDPGGDHVNFLLGRSTQISGGSARFCSFYEQALWLPGRANELETIVYSASDIMFSYISINDVPTRLFHGYTIHLTGFLCKLK